MLFIEVRLLKQVICPPNEMVSPLDGMQLLKDVWEKLITWKNPVMLEKR